MNENSDQETKRSTYRGNRKSNRSLLINQCGIMKMCCLCATSSFFVGTVSGWQGFIVASLLLATGVLLVSLFHLLFPPRYSNTRAVYVLGSLMGYIILLQKLFM